jgi:hypothetical protein
MREQDRAAVWSRYAELIPEELTAAGWTLWSLGSVVTLFGDPLSIAVLRKDLDDPDGDRVIGDGSTEEEALRGAIRQALVMETGGRG